MSDIRIIQEQELKRLKKIRMLFKRAKLIELSSYIDKNIKVMELRLKETCGLNHFDCDVCESITSRWNNY